VQSKKQKTTQKSASRNIRVIQAAFSIVHSTHLKPYSCTFLKEDLHPTPATRPYLFKDFRNQHYRKFIEDAGDLEQVQAMLGLLVIPHFTTLQKFPCRIRSFNRRLTFKKTVNLFSSSDE
jgi:hypothetical protein